MQCPCTPISAHMIDEESEEGRMWGVSMMTHFAANGGVPIDPEAVRVVRELRNRE